MTVTNTGIQWRRQEFILGANKKRGAAGAEIKTPKEWSDVAAVRGQKGSKTDRLVGALARGRRRWPITIIRKNFSNF